MSEQFSYDVFLSHSGKDKAVVRPLAERLGKDGLNRCLSAIHPSAFILQLFRDGSLTQFLRAFAS